MADPIAELGKVLPTGYELLGHIGTGGQGAVFRGTRRGVPVALKLFGTADVPRLEREMALLQKVKCEYLPGLLDFHVVEFQGRRIPMFAYEYIDGPNLRSLVQSRRVLDEDSILCVGEHVGTALEELWIHRIVHRDVKPENIIAGKNGRYVLVDVGFAQHLDLSTITRGGQPGTNGYRSPEQCGGRTKLTIHSDVFSLGTTLFEIAALQHPWNGDQAAMLYDPPANLETTRVGLDRRLVGLIYEMLSIHPARRPSKPGVRCRSLRRNGVSP